jgi:hypothetical protein
LTLDKLGRGVRILESEVEDAIGILTVVGDIKRLGGFSCEPLLDFEMAIPRNQLA